MVVFLSKICIAASVLSCKSVPLCTNINCPFSPLDVTAFFFNPLNSSGHYMYRQFNIQQFHVLPTQCIYVFRVDLRTNSDYFPIQH